jgi:hypothetical protein
MSGNTHLPAAEAPHADDRASPGSSTGTDDGPSGARPPDPARPGNVGRQGALRTARRIVIVACLAATAVQIVVWLAICVATVSVDAPWWLWTLLVGALVIGVLRLLETTYPHPLTKASTECEQQR